jgi:hypothetical protein
LLCFALCCCFLSFLPVLFLCLFCAASCSCCMFLLNCCECQCTFILHIFCRTQMPACFTVFPPCTTPRAPL